MRMTHRQHRRNKGRGLDRPAVGEYRYRRDMSEIGRGALSAKDDRGRGSCDEGEP